MPTEVHTASDLVALIVNHTVTAGSTLVCATHQWAAATRTYGVQDSVAGTWPGEALGLAPNTQRQVVLHWILDHPGGNVDIESVVNITAGRGCYVMEIGPSTVADFGFWGNDANDTIHYATAVNDPNGPLNTAADIFAYAAVTHNANVGAHTPKAGWTLAPYTQNSGVYGAQYIQSAAALVDDRCELTAGSRHTFGAAVAFVTAAGPAGPTQDTPTANITENFGTSGSRDISGDWTSSGGALTFGNLQNAPTGLTITAGGVLQWTNAVAVGTTANITYDATDDNGTVTSNAFSMIVSANPPTEDTPVGNQTVAIGFTGTVVDVSGNYTLGAGGTGPLQFFASASGTAWPAWLSIDQNTGVISSNSAVSTVAGLQVRVEDSTADPGAAINDSGTPFQVTVSAGGTLTTPPFKDEDTNLVTGQTGMTVTVQDATATGAPVYEYSAINQSQEADGTLIIGPDPAITTGDWYIVQMHTPDPDPPNAGGPGVAMLRGVWLLQAT